MAAEFAVVAEGGQKALGIEHPIGSNMIVFDESGRAQVLRTARNCMTVCFMDDLKRFCKTPRKPRFTPPAGGVDVLQL